MSEELRKACEQAIDGMDGGITSTYNIDQVENMVKRQRAAALETAANDILTAFCKAGSVDPKVKYITDAIVEFLHEQQAKELEA